jgi:hypothetical protein
MLGAVIPMKHTLLPLVLFGALLTTSASAQIEVGQEMSFTFQNSPVNSYGVQSLDDLRGRPVFVEFWGTR